MFAEPVRSRSFLPIHARGSAPKAKRGPSTLKETATNRSNNTFTRGLRLINPGSSVDPGNRFERSA